MVGGGCDLSYSGGDCGLRSYGHGDYDLTVVVTVV